MRRGLAILKYVPAVLCGLLVVAWVSSWFIHVFVGMSSTCSTLILAQRGTVIVAPDHSGTDFEWGASCNGDGRFTQTRVLGSVLAWPDSGVYAVPIPAMVTLLAPLAAGCLSRFRFALWSYFAWTALIAAELAYYLR